MNRTKKRISEYPFQPLRRNVRRFPVGLVSPEGDFTDSAGLAAAFYRTAAVAKLGL
jgi:hypothetical protein